MKKFLINLYLWVLNKLKPLKWFIECRKERDKVEYKPSIELGFKGKCLILLPHVDDEWMGCSQLLLQKDLDVLMLDMDMPGGDSDVVHRRRKDELKHVGKTLNKPIQKVGGNKAESLRSIILEWKPNYVFLPFFIDWHEEHIEVMSYLKSALENCFDLKHTLNIVGYQVSAPIPGKFITHVQTMSKKTWKTKWQLFKSFYPSQVRIPYKRFALQERVNGAYSKSFAVEVFSVNTVTDWIESYNRLLPNVQEINELKNNLSSISQIRNTINTIICKKNMII